MNGLTLGIDTGGTYTDGVLLDPVSGEIIGKSKAFTTREDLSIGIRECINNLGLAHFNEIRLVALSTTLATNAIVEGRGCRVGLVLIGHEEIGNVPAHITAVVPGGHDVQGQEQAELDLHALAVALEGMKDKVDTVAVSGYLSIRNPEHELAARKAVQDILGLPVVCAHQLTSELGFQERTVTACLNARLLPIIAELLEAVKNVLREKGIKAPLMVVKGDGSLMSEEMTREKPIETILSGPAASIVGATFLTGSDKALVLDMGGTTTDIAILEQGRPRIKAEGASVGGWRTRVEAADISTFGLGGDSYLKVSLDQVLTVGPKRVWPLAAIAHRFPHLSDELSIADAGREIMDGQPTDCWMLLKAPRERGDWTASEWAVIESLKNGPHNILALAEGLKTDPNLLPLRQLENSQILGRISFTPTDVLHALDRFIPWNKSAAIAGARILARRMGMELQEFLELALEKIEGSLALAILQSLVNYEGINLDLAHDRGAGVFVKRFLKADAQSGFKVQLKVELTVVAIGAPVKAYLPAVGESLHTEVLIPPFAEVANAVGAAVGQVVETMKLVVKPGAKGGFVIHAPWEPENYALIEEAEARAIAKAEEVIRTQAERAGAVEPQVVVDKDRVTILTTRGDSVFIETRITVSAVGRPRWS
ncbi:MAG: hydantoinase/oxoprolinase family protein [Desulfitobacteriaceae bacterium]